MARALSRTLNLPTRFSPKSILTSSSSLISQSIAASTLRYRSTLTPKAQLIEIDVDSSSSDGTDVEVLGLNRLEDAIHSIIVQRSAPSWLIFRPGSSYWVPPKPDAANIVQLVSKLSNPLSNSLSEDESLSFTSDCGWPSSSYFVNGNTFLEPLRKEVEVKVHVRRNGKPSKSEDEE